MPHHFFAKKTPSVILSAYDIVWLVYTAHYIALFAIISTEQFEEASRAAYGSLLLPLNIIMNSISIVLAVIGVLLSYYTSRQLYGQMSIFNTFVHYLMIAWVFGGSLWVIFLMR